MKIEIDSKIIQEAIKCQNNHDCLISANNIYCKVNDSIDKKVFFVECLNSNYCNFKMLFASAFMCTCPVRIEIYNKYKK